MNRPIEEGWHLNLSSTVFQTPFLSLEKEIWQTPFRANAVEWLVAHRKQAVVIAPRTTEGNYLLIRQQRIPIRQTIWEFPAGQIDGEVTEATILDTVHRELREEAGCEVFGDLTPLGHFFSSPGFTDECMHAFLAHDVDFHPQGAAPDHGECILEVGSFSPEELVRMVAQGQINDANTLTTIARLSCRQLL